MRDPFLRQFSVLPEIDLIEYFLYQLIFDPFAFLFRVGWAAQTNKIDSKGYSITEKDGTISK